MQWAANIYGPYIGHLKAHTTRRRPNPVVDTSIDITDELLEAQKDATIVMDGLTINGLKFISAISLHIYFRKMHYMTNTTAVYYQRALNEINIVYELFQPKTSTFSTHALI